MGKFIYAILVLASMAILPCRGQQNIILDTDFGGDADDLGALIMLNHLSDQGQCNLLSIMVCANEHDAVAAVDATNLYYDNEFPIATSTYSTYHNKNWYNREIASKFLHRVTNSEVPLATAKYRELLVAAEDGTIQIVTVGPLNNIRDLLQSAPDSISPLSGSELVAQKVKGFTIMGGRFPSGEQEWNFYGNMPGVTKWVVENLEVPVTFVGAEVGDALPIGREFNELKSHNPLSVGFLYFSEFAPWKSAEFKGEILDNSSFDQVALLHAIYGDNYGLWDISPAGVCSVSEDGETTWSESADGDHRYLIINGGREELRAKLLELMTRELE